MNNIKDDKLELYITKIKTSNNNHNKVLNYKRASNRINELKIEYNKFCEMLKPKKKCKKNTSIVHNISIDQIMTELNNIDLVIDQGTSSMRELIDNYIRYKLLLSELELESEQIKNEIFEIKENKNKIIMNKLDDIL